MAFRHYLSVKAETLAFVQRYSTSSSSSSVLTNSRCSSDFFIATSRVAEKHCVCLQLRSVAITLDPTLMRSRMIAQATLSF